MHRQIPALLLLVASLWGCGPEEIIEPLPEAQAPAYDWGLPEWVAPPKVPADNPMSAQKAELGRYLFYDKRLSGNGTYACATCHEQARAFTDGRALAIGSTGQSHRLSSMSLVNVGYATTYGWGNPTLRSLEQQAVIPMMGQEPIEMGIKGHEEEVLGRLRQDERYQALFADAFPGVEDPFTLDHVIAALASFQRTLISLNSAFDRYIFLGEDQALSASAYRGYQLFNSEALECFHCHGGLHFSDSSTHEGKVFDESAFHNTNLYNVDGQGAYPEGNQGVYDITGDSGDRGRFKAPTLRNIAVTAPYMHDGSLQSLEEVVDHYAAGGRAGKEGQNPNKSSFISGFSISQQDRADLVAFLESLTDEDFLVDPRFSDPFLP